MSNLIEWGGDRGEFWIIFQIVTLEIKVTDQRGEYEDYRPTPRIENAETTGGTLPLLILPPSLSSLPSSFPLSLASIHPLFLIPLFPSLSLASLKLKFSKKQRMLASQAWTAGRNVIIAQKEAMLSLACTRQGKREHCNSQGLGLSSGQQGEL